MNMKDSKYIWIAGLVVTTLIIVLPIALLLFDRPEAQDDPWANIPPEVPSVSHADIIQGPFESGSDVTQNCLECHPDAAEHTDRR